MTTLTSRTRPAAATWVGVLSLLGALGSLLLCIGHLGVDVPLLSSLGPGGDRAVPVAAAIFAVGAVAYAVVGLGALRLARWAWLAGVVVHALAILAGLGQFRGAASAVGILLSLAALVVLASPSGRRALRHR